MKVGILKWWRRRKLSRDIPGYITERVRLGAELLDKKRPLWWWHVNTDKIDMQSPTGCVLGQVYGGYGTGIVKVGLGIDYSGYEQIQLGFIVIDDEEEVWLRAAWTLAVRERDGRS